jgi:REP element-mobilizing transposase RayT
MSTYTQILYQIVFGSKNCRSFMTPINQENLFNYIAGIARNKKCIPYCIGGHSNHLHLVVHIHPTAALADIIRDVKKGSNDWLMDNKHDYPFFSGWQIGYAAFTYDYQAKGNLVKYVKNQLQHHNKVAFHDELKKLLEECGIKYDNRYLFV